MQFAVSSAHLLNDLLHFACVGQLALHQLPLEALLDLGSEVQLVVHALVFVQKTLHVATLSLLQMGRLQFHVSVATQSRFLTLMPSGEERIEISLDRVHVW